MKEAAPAAPPPRPQPESKLERKCTNASQQKEKSTFATRL